MICAGVDVEKQREVGDHLGQKWAEAQAQARARMERLRAAGGANDAELPDDGGAADRSAAGVQAAD